jgi:hypothetical protein
VNRVEPPRASPPRGFAGAPPKDWKPEEADAPRGFAGGPPKDSKPEASATASRGFAGGPPKDWKPEQTATPPGGFAGAPPKDWKPEEKAPPSRGFAGGPPKDWKPEEKAPPSRGFAGAPPKDWKPEEKAPPSRGFAGAPPKDWKPEDASTPGVGVVPQQSGGKPPRTGFVGGPPRDWKAAETDGPRRLSGAPPPSSGPDNSLWAFAQEMPTHADGRLADESDRQRALQHEAILEDIRERTDGINHALEADLPEQVLKMAYELKDYIIGIMRVDDDQIGSELERVQAVIDQLEKAGYRVSTPLDGLRENAISLSKTTLIWLASAGAVVILVVWGIMALIRANAEADAKYPGKLAGTVSINTSIEGKMLPTRVSRENVRVVEDNAEARTLLDKLLAYHNPAQAFKELKTKRGALPAIVESTTNPEGSFMIQKVPPGKYFAIVVTSKNEEEAGAWMVPFTVEATKITEVSLEENNRIK